MSVPELFHHENLFVGSLAVRKIKKYRQGAVLNSGTTNFKLTPSDAEEISQIYDSIYFDADLSRNSDYCYAIMTQGLDYESLKACPALNNEGRCSIHNNRKPTVCSMVPFDSAFPNALQHIVLMSRRFEENCIMEGEVAEYEVVIKDRLVINSEYRDTLLQHREEMLYAKKWWGNDVFAMLLPSLNNQVVDREKISFDGYLMLPLIPVLMVLADMSEKCRSRCLQYLDSQISLINIKEQQALNRKNNLDKPLTKELRSFRAAYLKFRSSLNVPYKKIESYGSKATWDSNVIENYLGIE
jgi:Fe-S-cluster containining protein